MILRFIEAPRYEIRSQPPRLQPNRRVARLSALELFALFSSRRTSPAVRLQLHALAHNLGNFMRTLAMLKVAERWSLTSLP